MKIEKGNQLVRFNKKRAGEIFPRLAQAWRNKEGLLGVVTLPEERYLKYFPEDKEEIARLLFYCAHFMRGGIISDDPFLPMMVLYRLHPDLFDPLSVVKSWPPERIKNAFRIVNQVVLNGNGTGENGAGVFGYKLDEHARYWRLNSNLLAENWDGSVISVFQGTSRLMEAYQRMEKRHARFFGMRLKIMSLLATWLQTRDILPVGAPFSEKRPYPTPFPVDFHMVRFLYSQGIIDFPGMTAFDPSALKTQRTALKKELRNLQGKPSFRITEAVTDAISLWSDRMMDTLKLHEIDIALPIWFWSRNYCAGSIQNRTETVRNPSTGEKEVIFFDKETLLNHPELWPYHYSDPCENCMFNSTCRSASPSRVYYKVGRMVFLERIKYQRSQRLIPGSESHYYPFTGVRVGRNRNGFHFMNMDLRKLKMEAKQSEDALRVEGGMKSGGDIQPFLFETE